MAEITASEILMDADEVADAIVAARQDVDARPHDEDTQRRYWALIRNAESVDDDDWTDGLGELIDALAQRAARAGGG